MSLQLLKQPRLWLLIWGGAGAAFLIYVIISASVSPKEESAASALRHDQSLLTGEMADFAYAFPPRGSPLIAFQHEGKSMTLADFRGKAVLAMPEGTAVARRLGE